MQKIVITIIQIYQKTLSPDHGLLRYFFPYGYCKFYPSCSEYSARSVQKLGVLLGITTSFFRLLRCHPFSKGGFDEVK